MVTLDLLSCTSVNVRYNLYHEKETILDFLASIKPKYRFEGFIIKALFGSYSRGEADENSDIDILVEATPEFAAKYGFGAIVNLAIIEWMIRNGLPKSKRQCLELI